LISKEEKDQKDQEKLLHKQDLQKLLEQEEATVTAAKPKQKTDLAPKKVTQAQIQQRETATAAAATNGKSSFSSFHSSLKVVLEPKRNNLNEREIPVEENINRLQIDGDSARNVDEALHVLQ
jgi:Trp operon repressor